MYCYCKDEFDWLMVMLKKGKSFSSYEDIDNFIDNDLLKLRYMKKRFGYLFYDESNYIKKVDGRNAIFVNKEHQFVCIKPEEPTYHEINKKKSLFNKNPPISITTIPMESRKLYEIKFLDEIDRGDPFITKEEKYKNEKVKKTENILKKIKLLKPEIYNSDEFYKVLYSSEFSDIKIESDIKKIYNQVKKYVLNESEMEDMKLPDIHIDENISNFNKNNK